MEWDVCGVGRVRSGCGACAERVRSEARSDPQLSVSHYYLSFSNGFGLKPHIFICNYLYMCSSDSMYTCTC